MTLVPTEPGSELARDYGCTCPKQTPQPIAGGGLRFERDPACPLHRRPFAADTAGLHRLARATERRRERIRATGADAGQPQASTEPERSGGRSL